MSDTVAAETNPPKLGPPLPQEMPKPPFRPKASGTIAFFFGVVAGALVSAVSLRRMGYLQKARKVIWVTILGTAILATILLLIPDGVGGLVALGLEAVWYIVFPRIQNEEFKQWQADHNDVVPSNGWKALGWAFLGVILVFVIFLLVAVLLDVMKVAPH